MEGRLARCFTGRSQPTMPTNVPFLGYLRWTWPLVDAGRPTGHASWVVAALRPRLSLDPPVRFH